MSWSAQVFECRRRERENAVAIGGHDSLEATLKEVEAVIRLNGGSDYEVRLSWRLPVGEKP
jgi:hypothetical protein